MYTIYTKTTCSFCIEAKKLLTEKKLSYLEKNIEDVQYKTELLTLVPNAKTVPQIFLDDKHIGGYTSLVAFFNQTI